MTIEEDDDKLLNDGDDGQDTKSDEVWSEKAKQKYDNLKKVIDENIPDLWPCMEFSLAVKLILNMEGCSLPFAGIILGPSGGLKTVDIELFRECENTFYTDSFTPRSLVSHNSAVKKEKLKDVD